MLADTLMAVRIEARNDMLRAEAKKEGMRDSERIEKGDLNSAGTGDSQHSYREGNEKQALTFG
jgi:hypothetical protein